MVRKHSISMVCAALLTCLIKLQQLDERAASSEERLGFALYWHGWVDLESHSAVVDDVAPLTKLEGAW